MQRVSAVASVPRAFDLDGHVRFSADAQYAAATQAYEANVTRIVRGPALDYYDMSVEVADRTGSGAGTLIAADLDLAAIVEGMPERLPSADVEYVYLLGMNEDGDIVTLAGNTFDGPVVPGATTVQFAIGGGESNGYSRNVMPLSADDSVVEWRIQMQPAYTERDR